jgi:transcriptional regulator with XRE-family HTH domain
MEQNDQARAEIVGCQIKSLLSQSGLSIVGLAHAIEMSVNHLRTAKNGKASISGKTAGKIADFFGIEIGVLFSARDFRLKKLENIENLQRFYIDNENNPQFFVRRKGENSVAHFLKEILLPSGFFSERREVNEIQSFIKKHYKRDFTSKELSRQLTRLFDAGMLIREDKTGNRSIFLYKNK